MTSEIRQLSPSEVAELILWAKAEGWNPGLDDAAPFYAADPSGFLGCFVGGRMVAGISAVASGPDFGFIGLYICHPHFRGQGYGRKVWDAGMTHLGARTIGLDAVPAQQKNYQTMGFEIAYRTWRHSGRFTPASVDRSVVSIGPARIDAIAAFDRRYYPGARREFLKAWIDGPRIARAILRDGSIAAYGVLRKCHEGHKVGPLFSKTENDAVLVFDALCACADGQIVSIDVPEASEGFASYLSGISYEKTFDTMRMYRGAMPHIHLNGVFGISTLELG